ncbi:tetratricopeptide repeat protein [Hazenella sp. IB182357]|uniref:Tetratricopeptide repeat protein n=1 Tax=Polycladospora coralii TaxID=2771432 RepID=A0A926NAF5_9BACL|nr:helix-turn-helix transcriptional regulator [Polycladospora coralii]MBD1372833.1 tetratricopeptide repeat protein [Polycladospora coralii]
MEFDRMQVGKFLKIERKKQNKRMDDLVDENISKATISNLERGLMNVSYAMISYYATKLGVEQEIHTSLEQKRTADDRIALRLRQIKTTVDIVHAKSSLQKLEALNVSFFSDYYPMFVSLKGRSYLALRQFRKAEKHFMEAKQIYTEQSHLNAENGLASCLYDLARISYYRNDHEKALSYASQGLKSFHTEAGNEKVKHLLMIAKAIYLEKLNRSGEALSLINALWKEIHLIRDHYVLLNMYEIKAIILKDQKQFKDAINLTFEGIELARSNQLPERLLELWTLLGGIYLETDKLDDAESCLLTALTFKNKISNQYLLVTSYTLLGTVYMKLNRMQESFEALELAVSYGEKTNDTRRLAIALYTFGNWHQEESLYKKSFTYYQRACDLIEKHKFTSLLVPIFVEMTKCAKHVDAQLFHECLAKLFETEVQLHHEQIIV